VFITQASFTGSSAVNIDGCFSATYTHYIVKRNFTGTTANTSVRGRLRVSATDATGADYRFQSLEGDSTTVASGRSTGQTYWANAFGWVEDTASFGYSETWISNPFEAVRTTAWNDGSYDADASIRIEATVYAHDLATSYTSLTVYPAAGTITGTISVWGLAKS
jgi:hypothetical protein